MISNDELKNKVVSWAERIGVKPVQVHVRKMKRKWASCSSRGRLTFNSDILGQTKKFLDQVIVHELLHLKYPNHGRMFKVMMRNYLK